MSPSVIPLRHPQSNPVENIDPPCDVEAPIEFPEMPSSPTGRLRNLEPRMQELRELAERNSPMVAVDLNSVEARITAYYGMTPSEPTVRKVSRLEKFLDYIKWYGVERKLDKRYQAKRALLYSIGMSDRTRLSPSDQWLFSKFDRER
jgi:hypothetical protein